MLASDPVRSKCLKQRVLCRTLAGNYVYVLTITAPAKRRNEAEVSVLKIAHLISYQPSVSVK